MRFFRKKGKKGQKKKKKWVKKGNIYENLWKNIQNLKIFWKRAGNKLLEKTLIRENLGSKFLAAVIYLTFCSGFQSEQGVNFEHI